MSKYRWVYHESTKLLDVGILEDGTLHNPHGYPPEIVRAAVMAADAQCRALRSAAAKKAAITRQRRQERRVWEAATRLANNHATGPRENCFICGRHLDDAASIQRGIGSECWQWVLGLVDVALAKKGAAVGNV